MTGYSLLNSSGLEMRQ